MKQFCKHTQIQKKLIALLAKQTRQPGQRNPQGSQKLDIKLVQKTPRNMLQ